MVYIFDYGESLGRNNVYLPGMPYQTAQDMQKHVLFIVWFPEEYEATYGISQQSLESKQNDPISYDNLFISMLGLLDIETKVYD